MDAVSQDAVSGLKQPLVLLDQRAMNQSFGIEVEEDSHMMCYSTLRGIHNGYSSSSSSIKLSVQMGSRKFDSGPYRTA